MAFSSFRSDPLVEECLGDVFAQRWIISGAEAGDQIVIDGISSALRPSATSVTPSL